MISERESETTRKQTFLFGEFAFETGENILWREGEIVQLPPKTCELLAVFIKEAGRLLTKEKLMNTVWENTFVEEANLSHHIAVLRKALGEDKNANKFIETIPRKGYRFVAPVTPKNKLEVVVTERTETRVIEEEIEAPDNPLIGREKELAIVKNLLRRADTRLLTLTGVGGAGKTALARAVLQEISGEFPGGAEFVDLSAVVDSGLVLSTVAQSLKINASGEENLTAAIKNALRERRMLLVLDNFEQILDAAAQLAQIISNESKILVTSRARLYLSGERKFQVPPLDLPTKEKLPEEMIECSSVRLFVERARSAKPNFALTDENAAAVAEICRRLDGLPLAIELAAARARILAAPEISARLGSQLKLLSGASKSLPTRQQTIRNAIAWSYALLTGAEKKIFESLSVFAGSFTIEAAETIVGSIEAETNILDAIDLLLDANLLWKVETADGAMRFRYLEAIREFAAEQLEKTGVTDLFKQKHADYFINLAETADAELKGARQSQWLERLEAEHDNLRAALSWLQASDSPDILRLTGALHLFWSIRGYYTEGRNWLDKALQKSGSGDASACAKAFFGAGQMARLRGDFLSASEFYKSSLRFAEEAGEKRQIAIANHGLAVVAYQQNEFAAAREFFETALPISLEIGDKVLNFTIQSGLGEIARLENDLAAARRYNEECARYTREIGNKNQLCGSLVNLGAISATEDKHEEAFAHYTEAVRLAEELNLKSHIALCLDGFAAFYMQKGDLKRAAMLSGSAENLRAEIGYELETPDRIFRRHYLTELQASLTEAEFNDFLSAGRELGIPESINLALVD